MLNPEPETAEQAKQAAAEGTSRFSRFHSQTFEMELLVSGAVTFALVQIPPYLGDKFERTIMYLDGNLRLVVTFGFVYVSLAVMALIAFFAGNLLLRAFWIGLVGLESVFPGGTDWQRLKVGPHSKRLLQARMPSLSESIERIDDVCSLTFSLAFTIVLTFIYSIAAIAVCFGAAWGLSRLGAGSLDRNFGILLLAFFLLTTAVPLIDRFFASRLAPGSRLDRGLAWLVRVTLAVSPLRLVGAISLVLQSRMTEKRSNFLIAGSMFLVAIIFMMAFMTRNGFLRFGSLIYLPEDAGTEGVDAESYRSSWGEDDFDIANWRPSIDTDIVTEPYLRLFLPYRPFSHNSRIADACPDLEPLRRDGLSLGRIADPAPREQSRRSVECFVGLFGLRLDGQSLEGVSFDWFTEPMHRVPGAIAYLDVRSLAPGRHLLEVDAPRGLPALSGEQDQRRLIAIPFWR